MIKRFPYTIPFIKINFNDNPYLLKDHKKYDYYNIVIPAHIYIKECNNLHIFSMFDNRYKYLNNKENINQPVTELFGKVKLLLEKHTINNQNITLKDKSLSVVYKDALYYKFNNFPLCIYPEQYKINQYQNNFRVVKSPYDIKTILTFDNSNEFISDIYKKVDFFKL